MRVAALYDIHANLPALEAAVADARKSGVDRIVVGGDVLPGPMPAETIRYLRDLDIPTQYIFGNGDREVLQRMRGIETDWYRNAQDAWREPVRWSAEQLNDRDRDLIASWPATLSLDIDGFGEVLFCHATPRNDTDVFTRLTAEERLLPIFAGLDAGTVVCGHSHMQFDRKIGKTRVLNAGSVGMPFGKPGADWLLLGPEIVFRHTDYDLLRAAERVRATRYPQADDFASRNILRPPSEEDTLKAYGGVELKQAPPGDRLHRPGAGE